MDTLVIIGGSDAGISAALRAKEVNPSADVEILLTDRFPNYSICGLPFFLSGEVPDWRTLAHRTIEEIEKQGVHLLLGHKATRVDPESKTVTALDASRKIYITKFDKLVIATGAASVRPALAGIDLPGVFLLRWMDDGFSMHQYLVEHHPESAVILGSGYIGMEMADALTRRGLSVTVLARSGRLLKTVDEEMGNLIENELLTHGVKVVKGIAVRSIEENGKNLAVRNSKNIPIEGNMVLVATGARPEASITARTGISTGLQGAIRVNRAMETNLKNVYAAGDCVETWHHLTKKYTYLPLGTTAHKQGRVAGENAVGGHAEFLGSLGTQVVKIFDLVIARTGLPENEALEAGFDPVTIDHEAWDHKVYYPGATPIRIRITGDRKTHQLLGAQIAGRYGAEVSKRIDILATAIFNEMTVDSLSHLDLSYTPPLSSPWDAVQMASQAWMKEALSMEKPKNSYS
jgi:NADPH-dependent 2,4-dienoyl-CoA reductase/sulfur reductase-like enzyme